MCHYLSGATYPVNSSCAVTGATTGPPVNGGQRRSMGRVTDGQRWRTTVDHHRSTTGQRSGQMVATTATWQHVAADVAVDVALRG
ncbi:hypothetical protein Tco_0448558 [Tanacetum coccineum]